MYSIQQRTDNILSRIPFMKSSPKAVPNGASGHIDVVNKFVWKNGVSTDEVPSITLTEYELEFGSWMANVAKLMSTFENALNDRELDPYIILYNAKPTNFVYHFPWLLKNGDKIRTINNSWVVSQNNLMNLFANDPKKTGTVSRTIGAVAGNLVGAVSPGVGTETVYEYDQQSSREELTITFPLYNTVTTQDAYNNYKLVSLLTFQNLKTRTSFITYIPPKIYKVKSIKCLGGLDWPAAIVKTLDIESIGTTREIREYSGQTILMPEAYKVSITLQQLLPSSANTFYGAIGGRSVNVIDTAFTEADVTGGVDALLNNLRT
jgi:hypothetical protein